MTAVATEEKPPVVSGSLIRAVEIWLPASDGVLAIDQSYYESSPALKAASEGLSFQCGEGLPGQVYESRQPIVFRDFGDSDFARTEAAGMDGLVAGFGVPVLYEGNCIAVVVLLFGAGEQALGGLECWLPIRSRRELTLGSSFYAGMPRFEKISRYVQFPHGSGLPGVVWADMAPTLLTGLATSKSFMRAAGAGAEGLSSAIAWPIADHGEAVHSVCVMLSAGNSPLAQVMQVWQPGAEQPLVLTRTDEPAGSPLREACRTHTPNSGDGLFGAVFENRLPRVIQNFADRTDPISAAAIESGLTYAISIPVYAGTELRGLVVLWN